eukprot:TRINITY_DN70626_c0_g1_i1.p1 TRINITY_DN70626_c0_g1~~TRINITY_DN70626_c0_g1_i1.p1  ORF type:complete len:434 (-),score=51.10 TRINITY_DN70626_c0_g1_i1:45-1346(-)
MRWGVVLTRLVTAPVTTVADASIGGTASLALESDVGIQPGVSRQSVDPSLPRSLLLRYRDEATVGHREDQQVRARRRWNASSGDWVVDVRVATSEGFPVGPAVDVAPFDQLRLMALDGAPPIEEMQALVAESRWSPSGDNDAWDDEESSCHTTNVAASVFVLFHGLIALRWPRGVVINIGASDGVDDPLWRVVSSGVVPGLYFEPDAARFKQLQANFDALPVVTSDLAVTPLNIPTVLEMARYLASAQGATLHEEGIESEHGNEGNVVVDVDILKIDIDSFDCAIVEPLLRGLRVRVLVMEINLWFPPPLRFARQYHPQPRIDDLVRSDTYGCSLSHAAHLASGFGLHLVKLSDDDAIFVSQAVLGGLLVPLHDEVECYRSVSVRGHGNFPIAYLREWLFSVDPHIALFRAWGNLTRRDRLYGLDDHPFSLML